MRGGSRCLAVAVAGALAVLLAATVWAQTPLRLLFIGNSLTYLNDVPSLVADLGRANQRALICEQVAAPDLSLEDHWRLGKAGRAIARGGWDVVILQQGPSALPQSRTLLVDYTRRFDREIRKAGAKTALYMVWPAQARRGDFPGVSRSYAAAADAVGALLLPAGDAWREAWQLDDRLPLYSTDGFHASLLGSQLAAIVIFEGVTGQPAVTLPFDLPERRAAVLQEAAARVRTKGR